MTTAYVTWAMIAALAAMLVLPLLSVLRGQVVARDRAEADRALFASQLAELEREHAAGRMTDAAHRDAVIEVQRRLLAAPAPQAAQGGARAPMVAVLVAVPLFGLAFYAMRGEPNLPSATFAVRQQEGMRDELLLNQLRERISTMPEGEVRRQGLILLGNAERARGRRAEAAAAWAEALSGGFDAELTANLVEVLLDLGQVPEAGRLVQQASVQAPQDARLRFLSGQVEASAGRNMQARAIWRQLLADSPPNAPWRALVEQRMNALP